MAEEISIRIRQAHLGPAQPEIGLTAEDLKLFDGRGKIRVNVFVDGEPVELEKDNDSIVVKASLSPDDDKFTVVVTTKEDKILDVLQYDEEGEPIVDDPTHDGTAVIRGIGEAAQKIADAMAHPTPPSDSTTPRRTR
jgi:hypothetical protein